MKVGPGRQLSYRRLLYLLPAAAVRSVFGSTDIVTLALRRAARRKGFVVGRTLYAAAILVVIAIYAATPRTDPSDLPRVGQHLFIVLAIGQGLIALFVPPVLLAQTVAKERQDGTAELLLLTHGDPSHVIRGLVTSRLLLLFVVFLGGAPVASMAALLGGISFAEIGYLTLGCLLVSLFGAALGAFLGADVAPRLAPYLALVGSLVCLWLVQYPALFLAMIVGGLVGAGAPSWVVVTGIVVLVVPVLLLAHRLLTREAGRSLVRRLGQSVVPTAPPVARTPVRPPRRQSTARISQLERVLAPPLARVSLPSLALTIPAALLAVGVTWAIPTAFPVTEVVRTLLVALLGLAGFSLLGLLALAVLFYPAMQVSTLLSDATLVLVALAPVDPRKTLGQLERHASGLGAIWLALGLILVLPVFTFGSDAMPPAAALLAAGAVTLLVFFAGALSLYVGTRMRKVTRSLGAMAGIVVVCLASLLALAPWPEVLQLHPLAAPFVLGGSPGLESVAKVAHNLLLLPAALICQLSARRRLARMFREPFEELESDFAHFG